MKPPSSLAILLLVAALPTGAAAERKPGERCDAAFLEKVAKDFTGIDSIKDDRITQANLTVDGMTVRQDVLKFGEDKTCDAATWRFLAAPGNPVAWRNAGAKKYWEAGGAKNGAMVLLNIQDIFGNFDPKALKVLEAADAVIEAAAQLGIVTLADTAKPLSELLPGGSGGRFGLLKPKALTFIETKKQVTVVAPENAGASWRKLLDEKGASKSGGTAVMDFRIAVLELNSEVGRWSTKDFTPALPAGYVRADTKKPTAMADEKFGKALQDLIGAGETPAMDATAARTGSALEPADLGLRNLLAIRAAQVEKIVASAKERLAGKTITSIEVSARAANDAKDATPLAAAAMKSLAATKEYEQLDAMYDASVKKKGANDPETQAIAQAREDMKNAALTTKLEADKDGRQAVVFTQNGKRTVLGSIVPPKEGKEGDAARENAADVVARFIVEGAKQTDTYRAVAKAVLGGDPALNPGGTLPSAVTAAEIPVSKDVPPAIAKINAEGAGCKDPRDLYRNNYESYAARKQKAAAEMASGNLRSLSEIEALETKQKEASAAECQSRKDAAGKVDADSFSKEGTAESRRAAAMTAAEEWCKKDLVEIAGRKDAAVKKLNAETAAGGPRDPNKDLPQANKELEAAFGVAVTGSVSTLRKDYTNPKGSPRLTQLMADAKLNALSLPRLVAFNKLWFMERWPEGDEISGDGIKADERKKALSASLSECVKKLGFSAVKDKDSKVSYSNPENPDTVAKKCGIHNEITEWIKKKKGTVTE